MREIGYTASGFNYESIGNSMKTVSNAAVKDVLAGGLSRRLLHQEDIDKLALGDLSDPRQRAPEKAYFVLWQLLNDRARSADLGLAIGTQINPEAKGLLASWVSQCANLAEAFSVFQNHISLMNPDECWEVKQSSETVELHFSWAAEDTYPAIAIDRSLSALLAWGSMLSGEQLIPLRTELMYPEPANTQQHALIFGQHIEYNAQRYAIILPASVLHLPIASANTYLYTVLENEAKAALKTIRKDATMTERVSRLIDAHLDSMHLNIEWVAEQLNMSRQTLYRQLKTEETDFRHLLTERRMVEAKVLLQQRELSIYAISMALGYRDTSGFYKAFQRWFGESVAEFRRSLG